MGSNWMQSASFLADFSASTAYPPPHPRPLEARPAETRIRSEGVISNTVSQKKKAVMVAKDVAAVLVFLLGSFYCSPVYWGCTVSEGNALSGLPCRSGIWSWWLRDSLGWGIAVSAEQVTRSWSMGLSQTGLCAEKLWDGTFAQLKGSPSHFPTC